MVSTCFSVMRLLPLVDILHLGRVEVMHERRVESGLEIAARDGRAHDHRTHRLGDRLHRVHIGAVVVGMPHRIEIVIRSGQAARSAALSPWLPCHKSARSRGDTCFRKPACRSGTVRSCRPVHTSRSSDRCRKSCDRLFIQADIGWACPSSIHAWATKLPDPTLERPVPPASRSTASMAIVTARRTVRALVFMEFAFKCGVRIAANRKFGSVSVSTKLHRVGLPAERNYSSTR